MIDNPASLHTASSLDFSDLIEELGDDIPTVSWKTLFAAAKLGHQAHTLYSLSRTANPDFVKVLASTFKTGLQLHALFRIFTQEEDS